jgi:hypothetical protein
MKKKQIWKFDSKEKKSNGIRNTNQNLETRKNMKDKTFLKAYKCFILPLYVLIFRRNTTSIIVYTTIVSKVVSTTQVLVQ